jgi:hypothetical protein
MKIVLIVFAGAIAYLAAICGLLWSLRRFATPNKPKK